MLSESTLKRYTTKQILNHIDNNYDHIRIIGNVKRSRVYMRYDSSYTFYFYCDVYDKQAALELYNEIK